MFVNMKVDDIYIMYMCGNVFGRKIENYRFWL